jgi:Arc/MetJ-type ribon-helix-helix transcriptional regulator
LIAIIAYDMILSYFFIILSMSTISVPLPSHLILALEKLIQSGGAQNKAEIMRQALTMYLEYRAVQDVLEGENEPTLFGDIDELSSAISL